MSLPTADFRGLFAKHAHAHRLDPRWLEAQAMVESAGKPRAFRFEPKLQDASYGLMQVLEATARENGLPEHMNAAALCEPDIGIMIGARYMAWVLDRVCGSDLYRTQGKFVRMDKAEPEYRTALARYNGGAVGNPRADGSLRNEEYAHRVETWFLQVRAET